MSLTKSRKKGKIEQPKKAAAAEVVGSNPVETGEIVHNLLDLASDIQLERNGLITEAESLRLAKKYRENVIAEATERARDYPRIAGRLHRYLVEKKG